MCLLTTLISGAHNNCVVNCMSTQNTVSILELACNPVVTLFLCGLHSLLEVKLLLVCMSVVYCCQPFQEEQLHHPAFDALNQIGAESD